MPLEEPWISLRDAYHALRRQKRRDLVAFDISYAEYTVLDVCGRSPSRASEVAFALGITPAGVTDVLDRLEGRRLVRRVVHPSDRRAILVRLTPRGEALHRAAQSAQRTSLRLLRDAMTDGERRALLTGLAALNRALEPPTH